MKKQIFFIMLIIFILSISLFVNAEGHVDNKNYYPNNEWRISTPEQQGMDSKLLVEMFNLYGKKGRIIIIRNGFLVTNYDQKYLKNDIHHIHSCTKSIISALIGIALQEGFIKNANQPLLDFFPEYKKDQSFDKYKKKITLYHLLTMSSGMQWTDSIRPTDSDKMNQSKDWTNYVMSRPMVDAPGTNWNYNSGGSQLLSIILQKTTNVTAEDYAKTKLFQPLGINNVKWWKCSEGYSTAGWGLHLTSFDLAKIGYLFLREGQWEDQQLVPAKWVKESTKNILSVRSGFGAGFSYGYQWWVYNSLSEYAYKAWGSYRKHAVMIIVIPKLDMVVVLAGYNNNDRRLLKSYIIPSVKSSEPLEAKPQVINELNNLINQKI